MVFLLAFAPSCRFLNGNTLWQESLIFYPCYFQAFLVWHMPNPSFQERRNTKNDLISCRLFGFVYPQVKCYHTSHSVNPRLWESNSQLTWTQVKFGISKINRRMFAKRCLELLPSICLARLLVHSFLGGLWQNSVFKPILAHCFTDDES